MSLLAAGDAAAFRIAGYGRPFTGPRATYYAPDFKREAGRAARAVNRAHVGIRLRRARSKRSADILMVARGYGCGYGITTSSIRMDAQGRLRRRMISAVPGRCNAPTRMLTVVHEMAHALGLDHSRARCTAVSGHTLTRACKLRIVRGRQPYRRDDLAGLRRVWRDRAPRAAIAPGAEQSDSTSRAFFDGTTDPEKNVSVTQWDFGDPGSAGNVLTQAVTRGFFARTAFPGGVQHTFSHAGTFTVTLTARDTYGRRSTARLPVNVAAP